LIGIVISWKSYKHFHHLFNIQGFGAFEDEEQPFNNADEEAQY
jgi:hypothetical protein